MIQLDRETEPEYVFYATQPNLPVEKIVADVLLYAPEFKDSKMGDTWVLECKYRISGSGNEEVINQVIKVNHNDIHLTKVEMPILTQLGDIILFAFMRVSNSIEDTLISTVIMLEGGTITHYYKGGTDERSV